jgi:hypothetical protein
MNRDWNHFESDNELPPERGFAAWEAYKPEKRWTKR